jgi:hypothetical protein
MEVCMGSFALNLEDATGRVSRKLQPRFRGNDNVPIEGELSEKALLDIFRAYSGNGQVKELVAILAGQDWCITAGFHRGGLGGAAGGADQRSHITLSTGHHVRFDESRRRLVEITGPNITLSEARATAAAAQAGPTGTEQELERWYKLGLTQIQALKAIKKFHGAGNTMTRAAIAAEVQRNSKLKK